MNVPDHQIAMLMFGCADLECQDQDDCEGWSKEGLGNMSEKIHYTGLRQCSSST